MEKKIKQKMSYTAEIARIETTLKRDGRTENLVYKLIKNEDEYKITTTNEFNQEFGIEDFILLTTKHRALAIKTFAHMATNDIENLYRQSTYLIKE